MKTRVNGPRHTVSGLKPFNLLFREPYTLYLTPYTVTLYETFLVIRGLCPDPWYHFLTRRAMPVDHLIFRHIKPESIDQELAASMAVGFLPIVSGDIAGINVFQACIVPDLVGPVDAFRRGWWNICQAIGWVKTADVPWDVGVKARQEFGELFELFIGII